MTREQALVLYETKWWETKSPEEIVRVQLFEDKLCMPFSNFHEAVEKALGRSVWTHEFGLNWKGLQEEFLKDRPAPTMQEIMKMIPPEKRICALCDLEEHA
jgi:Na+-transporting NADH:ubiquinone oxidoreductase subunit NqrF